MTDKEELQVLNFKLNKLEQHLVNMIVPIQEITTALRDSSQIRNMIELLSKPLTIDDRFFRSILQDFTKMLIEFREASEKLDISKTLSEIKYIGKRLNNIEADIEKIKSDGVKRNVKLEFTCDGYELVKRPLAYEREDPIVEPNDNLKDLLDTLNEREAKVLIHRFGLFGEKVKTLREIAKLFKLASGESIRTIEAKALRKCRHPERKKYVDKITHPELRKAITGEI
jgi:DNA-directed RNA polymerase specialized sigma subunit